MHCETSVKCKILEKCFQIEIKDNSEVQTERFINKTKAQLQHLDTLLLTDIMSRCIALKVIPEVVSEDWEEWIMVLSQNKTVFSLLIVGFSISPVKPCDGGVPVRPPPVSWSLLTVSTL